MSEKVIAIVSGGLDSTTMVWEAVQYGFAPDLVSFNYGQRHVKELEYAVRTADFWHLRHDIVDLTGLTKLLAESGSSLVDAQTPVPEGHYAQENMKATVVPNRNMIMLAIAGGIAVSRKARAVMTGVHAGDHFIYPDCRPEFIQAAGNALVVGNEGFSNWLQKGEEFESAIMAPYLMDTKEDIALRALEMGMPFNMTWSCYQGGEVHCGRCGTCVERLEAIHGAMKRYSGPRVDNTVYADKDYWKSATGWGENVETDEGQSFTYPEDK
jgi:7-cyano-7-deazaguanine synthase